MNIINELIEVFIADKTAEEQEKFKLWLQEELPTILNNFEQHIEKIEKYNGEQK